MKVTITKTVDKPRYKVMWTYDSKNVYILYGYDNILAETDDLQTAKEAYDKAKYHGEVYYSQYVKMFELNQATGRYRLLDMRELKGRYIHER